MNFYTTIGRLVRTNSGARRHGDIGIVVDMYNRWFDTYEEELVVTVLYTNPIEQLEWTDRNLEILG